MPTHLGDLEALRSLVQKTVEAFGGIDVIVNNAANALALPLGEYTPEAWSKSLDVNLRGPVFLVQEALPHLKRSRHAAVLNVLSGGAFLFSATVSLYAIGKAGMMAATRAMAAEFAALRNPRERALAGHGRHRHGAQQPGGGAGRDDGDPADATAWRTRTRWSGRRCCSPPTQGSFITGHVVFADGGMVPR